MCLPNAVALLDATDPPGLRKNIVSVVFGVVAPGGAVIGAIFGGFFQDNWPWAVYSLALVLATVAIVSHFVKLDRLSKTVDRSRLRNIFPRPLTGFVFWFTFNDPKSNKISPSGSTGCGGSKTTVQWFC